MLSKEKDLSATHEKRYEARGILLTLVALLGLALAVIPAAAPYFGPGLPRANDTLPHLYRALALHRLVEAGAMWPRWSADLVHGYGYPVFNFFPSLSHWLIEAIHLLGVPLTMAYRIAGAAVVVLTAWNSYFLGRALWGAAGGWAAALGYTYSPYLLYDAHVRGSLPESLALALLPLLWLALWRACDLGRKRLASSGNRWIVATAVVFALLFLSHPVAYPYLILIGVWLLAQVWRGGWRVLLGPAAGLGLGGLLTAFFWLPALLELAYTRADASISQGYAYQQNFLSLGQMVRWPQIPADPALINPPVVRSLPVVAIVLAVLGLAWGWRALDRPGWYRILVWAGLLSLSVWLMMPSARPVWDHVPLLRLTFYPWRFLGMASLAGALLLGAVVPVQATSERRAWLWLTLTTVIVVTAAVPWLYPPREPVAERLTMADLGQFEQPPYFIGTTTLGEFLPRWVNEIPEDDALRQAISRGEDPDRLVVPAGVTAERLSGNTWDALYRLQADRASTLTYKQFYFPGWQAEMDGEAITLWPSEPHGLITLAVPAGDHRLHLYFSDTWPRRAGWLMSIVGLALTVGVWIRAGQAGEKSVHTRAVMARLPCPYSLLLLGVLSIGLWLFFSRVDTPLRRPTLVGDRLLGRPVTEPLDFAGELRLLSYEQSTTEIAADAPVQVTLFWRPLRPIGVVYDVGVQIIDETGLVWSVAGSRRPADWRFVSGNNPWPSDSYRMDPHILELLDGAPPGEYRFHVGLVRRDTGQTVAAHDLGHLVVTQPARGERPLEAGMELSPAGATAQGLTLLGTRLDRREARPGDPLRLTLLWQVESLPAAAEVTLQMVGSGGQAMVTATTPIAGEYRPEQWRPGDRLRTEVLLRLPAGAPPGDSEWQASLPGAETPWPVGSLDVQAIERQWAAPPLDIESGVQLGEIATLLGAILDREAFAAGAAMPVTLVWRAEAETATSYRVFLHLIDSDGRLVAQSDGEPANWSRPTSGWLPGEVILDEQGLALPPELPVGTYALAAGLYDFANGARLRTAGGADAVQILIFQAGG